MYWGDFDWVVFIHDDSVAAEYVDALPENVHPVDWVPGAEQVVNIPESGSVFVAVSKDHAYGIALLSARFPDVEFVRLDPKELDARDLEAESGLEVAKLRAQRRIDEVAEQVRSKYISEGSGQAMEYTAVEKEAERFLEGKPGAYPMLQADVDAGRAEDLAEAAQIALYERDAWAALGSAIRRVRLQKKREVSEAEDEGEVEEIRSAAIEELKGL